MTDELAKLLRECLALTTSACRNAVAYCNERDYEKYNALGDLIKETLSQHEQRTAAQQVSTASPGPAPSQDGAGQREFADAAAPTSPDEIMCDMNKVLAKPVVLSPDADIPTSVR